MKNIKKILIVLLIMLMCGCSKKSAGTDWNNSNNDTYFYGSPESLNVTNTGRYSDKTAYSGDGSYREEANHLPNVTENDGSLIAPLPSKIIVTSTLEMESSDLDKTLEQIEAAVMKTGGYVQTSKIYNNDYDYYHNKSAYIVVRVPADQYEKFMESSKEYGNVLSVSTSADDITTEYYDLSARLESLRQQRERVLEFYKQAKTIEDLIVVEQRLSEIDSEIAAKEITMKNFDLLTTYSTVTFDIREVSKFTDTEDTFFVRLKNAVSKSFTGFLSFLENTLFFVINSFWYVLLLIGAVLVIISLNRKHHFLKKPVFNRKKNSKESEETLS